LPAGRLAVLGATIELHHGLLGPLVLDRFLFAVELADEPRFDVMLGDLATGVLEQAGYAPADIADTLAKLRAALQEGRDQGQRGCNVQFRAEAGQLLIVLSYAGGGEWRVARALPD
jgi:hypothetical protein